MRESPASRYGKPVLGRVALAGGEAREEYIAAGQREDGTSYYVLNRWGASGRPRVVSEEEVVAVEPFGRPAC